VDTDLFSPICDEQKSAARYQLRQQLGFADSDIVCVYTGRFSQAKNPLALAEAIARLVSQGEPYRALFVGDGVQADAIRSYAGCVTAPFVPHDKLATLFRAANIGVWPTQESMSMLDAAACGIPIVVNDTLQAVERIDGNGITYKLNDVNDLVRALLSLREPSTRKRLGQLGADKMARDFSWLSIARRRLQDYEAALGSTHGRGELR
jgi:glycosyltransferase involved in cell wall biosynthesis